MVGWKRIEQELKKKLEYLSNLTKMGKVDVQSKEKYGTLRVSTYFTEVPEFGQGLDSEEFHSIVDDLEDLAEHQSAHTCQTCGKHGKLRGHHWYYTACEEHTRLIDRDYTEIVDKTWKSNHLPTEQQVLHAIMGLVGEASEAMEHIKKAAFYPEGQAPKLDRKALVLELGDALYYYTKLLNLLDISKREVEYENRKKLRDRNQHLFEETLTNGR